MGNLAHLQHGTEPGTSVRQYVDGIEYGLSVNCLPFWSYADWKGWMVTLGTQTWKTSLAVMLYLYMGTSTFYFLKKDKTPWWGHEDENGLGLDVGSGIALIMITRNFAMQYEREQSGANTNTEN